MSRHVMLVVTILGKAMLLLCVLAALVALGVMNRTDAIREQSHYCQMVKAGAWPDFHHSYKQECKP